MPGSGKTYALAQKGQAAVARNWPVWSNEGFDLKGSHIFSSFEDFAKIPQGCRGECTCGAGAEGTHPVVVLWDELPIYVNARKWQEFPDNMLYRLTQIRKDGLWLFYSAIDMGFCDRNVRMLTFWEYKCRAITSRVLIRKRYGHPELRKSDDRGSMAELMLVKEATAALYDTFSKVAVFDDKKPAKELPRTTNKPLTTTTTIPLRTPASASTDDGIGTTGTS
jgi:hypothetical protein